MFQIDNTLVSEEIISRDFVCNLNQCKGACCVEGEAGAPLEKEETLLLERDYGAIEPYMAKKGIQAIVKQGKYIALQTGEFETPLVENKECAYVVFDANGHTQCAIEMAHRAKKINWKKPISCHLYPIRVKTYSEFEAVNYHRWDICDSGCKLGADLKIPVYQFVREALVRKFGKKWFDELELAAKEHQGR